MNIVMALRIPAPAIADRLPNHLAELITGRTPLSHSQFSTMWSCPRKFAFQYVQKVPRDFVPGSLIFGGAIHWTLEPYFRARLEGPGVTHGALLSAYYDGRRRQEGGAHSPI